VNLVIDASVIVKWALPDSEAEDNKEEALAVLPAIESSEASVLQPPHWLAEVAAVLTGLLPEIAEETIELFDLMEFPMATDVVLLKRACRLARDLNHHFFDTLYHAVALEYDRTLVTADDQHPRKAKRLGRLIPLRLFSSPKVRDRL
jgi:predicted nucleic acid-binding protein